MTPGSIPTERRGRRRIDAETLVHVLAGPATAVVGIGATLALRALIDMLR